MKKELCVAFFVCIFFISITTPAQTVNTEWFKVFKKKNEKNDLKVITDSEGYIYVAGTYDPDSSNATSGKDWRLTKLNPNKDTVYNRIFNISSGGDDYLNDIAVDARDNVYLTGRVYGGSGQTSISLLKMSPSGTVIWQTTSSALSGINEGLFILLSDSGNVFVGGNCNAAANSDIFLNKYDSTGSQTWQYKLSNTDTSLAKGICRHTDGCVSIAGNINNGSMANITLLKINVTGTLAYQQIFNGPASKIDKCNDIDIDGDNNVYVTGYSENDYNKDFVTIKWQPNGTQSWYALFDGYENDDEATGVKFADDKIIVTGYSFIEEENITNANIVTILYDDRGSQQWMQKFAGDDVGNDIATGLLINFNNEILVTGYIWTEDNGYDALLLNYNMEGDLYWAVTYDDTLRRDDIPTCTSIDFLGIFIWQPYAGTTAQLRGKWLNLTSLINAYQF